MKKIFSLLAAILFVGTMWGTDVIYPDAGTTLNSNWDKSSGRVARQTVNSKVVIQLQKPNSGSYGELFSKGTYSNITGISVNATSNNNKSAQLTLYYSSNGTSWTEVSSETVSGSNSQAYNDYPFTITSLPSTAVYIKFRNTDSSNSVYIYSVDITTGSGSQDPSVLQNHWMSVIVFFLPLAGHVFHNVKDRFNPF